MRACMCECRSQRACMCECRSQRACMSEFCGIWQCLVYLFCVHSQGFLPLDAVNFAYPIFSISLFSIIIIRNATYMGIERSNFFSPFFPPGNIGILIMCSACNRKVFPSWKHHDALVDRNRVPLLLEAGTEAFLPFSTPDLLWKCHVCFLCVCACCLITTTSLSSLGLAKLDVHVQKAMCQCIA